MHGLAGLLSVPTGPNSSPIFFPEEGAKALFRNLVPPEEGGKIIIRPERTRNVPDTPIIPFIEGDGTGADIGSAAEGRRRQVTGGAA
jgi:hypothetical protein